MARRGEQLREHILWMAKDVFLELGFERASMDLVAARAKTSKRSLYAHFESKEKLFLAIIDFVRGLFLTRLRQPGDYADKPQEALVMFCSQYLQSMLYGPTVQMCRISMAESERFPEQSALYYDVLFTEVHTRVSAYLKATFRLSSKASAEAAQKLLGRVLFPRFPRVLFGLDPPMNTLEPEALPLVLELKPIRKAVSELIGDLVS